MSRRHDLRLLKKHANYTASELAKVLKVNILTIRRWCKLGLKPIDQKRPYLFIGGHVAEFLAARHKPRQPLMPGEIYCVACRQPRVPAGGLVNLQPISDTTANFIGTCPTSGHRIRRRVRIDEIAFKLGNCQVADEDDATTLVGNGEPPHTEPSADTAP